MGPLRRARQAYQVCIQLSETEAKLSLLFLRQVSLSDDRMNTLRLGVNLHERGGLDEASGNLTESFIITARKAELSWGSDRLVLVFVFLKPNDYTYIYCTEYIHRQSSTHVESIYIQGRCPPHADRRDYKNCHPLHGCIPNKTGPTPLLSLICLY